MKNKFIMDCVGSRKHSISTHRRGVMIGFFFLALSFVAGWSQPVGADKPSPEISVGALQFGTVNWELAVIQQQGLDRKHGFKLKVVPLGSKNASNVALLGGAVDVVVGDWIWVSRLRAENKPFAFVPYSMLVGTLYAHPKSGITKLEDLSGKSLGIAGGPVDKNWLLLRAYSTKKLGWDLSHRVEKKFVAPPLLNELMLREQLDAALTFWHYGARLEVAGMRSVVNIEDVLKELGVLNPVPLLGWIFDEHWADQHKSAVNGLIQASYEAKQMLLQQPEIWEALRPMMKAEDDKTFEALKRGYLSGIPHRFGEQELEAAAQTFKLLADIGGEELVGASRQLSPGTFWSGYEMSPE